MTSDPGEGLRATTAKFYSPSQGTKHWFLIVQRGGQRSSYPIVPSYNSIRYSLPPHSRDSSPPHTLPSSSSEILLPILETNAHISRSLKEGKNSTNPTNPWFNKPRRCLASRSQRYAIPFNKPKPKTIRRQTCNHHK